MLGPGGREFVRLTRLPRLVGSFAPVAPSVRLPFCAMAFCMSLASQAACTPSMSPAAERNGNFRLRNRFIPLLLFAVTNFCSAATMAKCMPWIAFPAQKYGRVRLEAKSGPRPLSAVELFFLAAPTRRCTQCNQQPAVGAGPSNLAAE